jgi:hypothetical protein
MEEQIRKEIKNREINGLSLEDRKLGIQGFYNLTHSLGSSEGRLYIQIAVHSVFIDKVGNA